MADIALPACLTYAVSGRNTSPMDAVGPANRFRTINTSPARITLTTLAIIDIIPHKALSKVVNTAYSYILICEHFWRVEEPSLVFVVAVCRIEFISVGVGAAGSLGADFLSLTTAVEMQIAIILIVHLVVVRVLAAIQIIRFGIAHTP